MRDIWYFLNFWELIWIYKIKKCFVYPLGRGFLKFQMHHAKFNTSYIYIRLSHLSPEDKNFFFFPNYLLHCINNNLYSASIFFFFFLVNSGEALRCYECMSTSSTTADECSGEMITKSSSVHTVECSISTMKAWHMRVQKNSVFQNIEDIFDVDGSQTSNNQIHVNMKCAKLQFKGKTCKYFFFLNIRSKSLKQYINKINLLFHQSTEHQSQWEPVKLLRQQIWKIPATVW